MEFQFKKDLPDLEKRKEQCRKLLSEEPNKVPIILEKDPTCKIAPIKKTRHLIKKDKSVNWFLSQIRKLTKIPEEQALFLSIKGKYSISGEILMDEIYKKYKDKEDGFLYISYSTEVIYG